MGCDLQLVLGHDKVQSGRADLDLLQDRRHPDARLRRQVPDLALDGARPYARRLPPGDGLPDRPVPARAEEKIESEAGRDFLQASGRADGVGANAGIPAQTPTAHAYHLPPFAPEHPPPLLPDVRPV